MPHDPLPPGLAPRIRGRVLFVEERHTSVLVDCVAAGHTGHGGEPVAAGTPFNVEITAGREAWSAATTTVIERWAGDDRLVEFQFRQRGDLPQVCASDGVTGMLLDLKTHAGA